MQGSILFTLTADAALGPVPIRERILATLAATLSADRLPLRDSDIGQTVVLVDQGETAALLDYETIQAELSLRIEVLDATRSEETRPIADNRLLARLIQVTMQDRALGGLCDDIVYREGGPLLTEDPTVFAGAYGEFTVRYRFDAGNPYTLTNY